jgi:hypothetical protein
VDGTIDLVDLGRDDEDGPNEVPHIGPMKSSEGDDSDDGNQDGNDYEDNDEEYEDNGKDEEDEELDINNIDGGETEDNVGKGIARTPFFVSWLVPIIRPAIAEAPMTSNKNLKGLLKLYGNDYAFIKSMLQMARTLACISILRKGTHNAQYILALKEELELCSHFVQVLFINCTTALNRLLLVVMAEEIQRRKAAGQRDHGLGVQCHAAFFLKAWKEENKEFIDEHLGLKEKNLWFVDGILFAPSTSKRAVPNLQTLYQADAAHLNWGKYTLYSACGSTTQAQCSPLAFGIIFGNEDTELWKKFWSFTLLVHPWLNNSSSTIVTDQVSQSKSAFVVYTFQFILG